jgi:RHS repeat-associated protein
LGSVIATAKADQSLEVGYAFSPYGQTQKAGVENQLAGSENSSQYTGRENDGNGLYFYRARYYDPVLKRFISEDPIGLAGGINSHAYVGGNPISATDPTGLIVQLCRRTADLLGGVVDHVWLKTDTTTAGMASSPKCRANVGDNFEAPYLTKVFVSDHSCEQPKSCDAVNDVDENCVNTELTIGKALGRFDLLNNSCQTFASEVLKKCSKTKKTPFTDRLFW